MSFGLGGRTALHYAAREGLIAAAAALLDAGADVNPSILSTAAARWSWRSSTATSIWRRRLLDRGANPNLAMKDGVAALYATIEAQWAPVSWTPTAFTAANGIVQQATDISR